MKIVFKGLLVAWHYREVPREIKDTLLEKASNIYRKYEMHLQHFLC